MHIQIVATRKYNWNFYGADFCLHNNLYIRTVLRVIYNRDINKGIYRDIYKVNGQKFKSNKPNIGTHIKSFIVDKKNLSICMQKPFKNYQVRKLYIQEKNFTFKKYIRFVKSLYRCHLVSV